MKDKKFPTQETLSLLVEPTEAGARLDRLLADRLSKRSRSEVQRWIEEGRVSLDGTPAHASAKPKAGQTIIVLVPPAPESPFEPEDIPLSVIYEDEFLAAIDKPAGMVVHPAAGHRSGTLVNALLARYPNLRVGIAAGGDELEETASEDDEPADSELRPGIVHRLDKDTSGLILVARSAEVQRLLQSMFQRRDIHKTYIALVEGVPDPSSGLIDAPIGRDPRQRKRMAVVHRGRQAQTDYRVEQAFSEYALVHAFPRTGRTHQIRVHMAHIKHSLVGDLIYGRRRASLDCPRHFLHATRLEFIHPVTGAPLDLRSPLPADLQAILKKLAPESHSDS